MQVSFSLGLYPSQHSKPQDTKRTLSISAYIDIIYIIFNACLLGTFTNQLYYYLYYLVILKKFNDVTGKTHGCFGMPN